MVWETWQLWVASGLALMVLEVFVPGFVLACLGLGSFGGAVAAYAALSFEWQLVIAAVTALIAFIFLRPFALKLGFSGQEKLSGVEALIGRECIVTLAFDVESGLGRCKVDGDDWRAKISRRTDASAAKVGQMVIVEEVESNTLIVSLKTPSS
jgi:membrane protein implicated in regulation of membrane protease activity